MKNTPTAQLIKSSYEESGLNLEVEMVIEVKDIAEIIQEVIQGTEDT